MSEAKRLTGDLCLLPSDSKTRTNKPDQTWFLKDGATKILLADSTLCLDGGAKSEPYLPLLPR